MRERVGVCAHAATAIRNATDFRMNRYYLTPGSFGSVVLAMRESENAVRSPAFFPGAGSRRAASGFFHLNARLATSPMIRASCSSVMSPGSGIVSSPPAHTAE